jgi:hypothetical protein
VLDTDPLTLITDERLEHKPEVRILLDLTSDLEPSALRRWVRATGPRGRPADLLLARDFGAFEDAVNDLRERGFILRGGGPT